MFSLVAVRFLNVTGNKQISVILLVCILVTSFYR